MQFQFHTRQMPKASPLTHDELSEIHSWCMEIHGQTKAWVVNRSAVENALHRHANGPFENGGTLIERAALLMRAIVQEHPFNDGNKRLGLAATNAFLLRNALKVEAASHDFEAFVLAVAQGMPVRQVAAWLADHTVPCEPVRHVRAAWLVTRQRYGEALHNLGANPAKE